MQIRNVKDGKFKNRYCGPAAVSAITGCSTGVAAHLMRAHSGRRSIKGSFTGELRAAFDKLGYTMNPVSIGPSAGVTIAQWLRETTRERRSRVFLLLIGHHWAVVQGKRYVCSLQREVCFYRDAPMRRARFHRAWEVTKTHGQRPGVTEIRRLYDDVRASTRAPRPEPSREEIRSKAIAAVEAKIKRWESRAKRAQTALRKLARSRAALIRAQAQRAQPEAVLAPG